MTVPDKLPNDIAQLKAIIVRQQDQNDRLEVLVAAFKKALFGSKSERIDPSQYELELEDIETAIGQVEAEVQSGEHTAPTQPAKLRQTNRGSLPKHLERVEVVIEPELFCACGAKRHMIGGLARTVMPRLQHLPISLLVACRLKPPWPMRSFPNMLIICRSIDKPKSTAVKGSICIVQPWLHGLVNRRLN